MKVHGLEGFRAKISGRPLDSLQALEEMIARADADADGEVTMDDFYVLMTQKSFPY